MTELSPYSKRRRRKDGVLEDGEYVDFDLVFCDSASRPASMTDSPQQNRAIQREVDRAHAAHDHKFAFLGDAAPKFDREGAEFLARTNASARAKAGAFNDALARGQYSEARAVTRDAYIERTTGKAPVATVASNDAEAWNLRDEARARYIRDQLRASRYEG